MATKSNKPQERILVADDEPSLRELLTELLTDEGYVVDSVATGAEVLERLQSDTRYDLLLLDLRMPQIDGLQLLERLRKEGEDIPVIMMTAHGTSSSAIRAMQMGAYDYLPKPFDNDEVLVVVKRLFEHQALASRVRALERREEDLRERMIGRSPAMREIYKTIGRVADSEASVLISGETGTGKELAANLIHQFSSRRNGPPPVKVNCAALPETLIESELFGHEKGAFTGAATQRRGKFELADGGTLFLDEVGDMNPSAQAKVLRVLQEGELERVGGAETIKVDVRVIAATNKNLADEIAAQRFREDLYYRLAVVPIELPPLRTRREDIPSLVGHFVEQVCAANDRRTKRVVQGAMTLLMQHDWPGNVRELKNVVERLVILTGEADVIADGDVMDALPRVKAVKGSFARGTPFKDLVA
ncbi:MAG TPA: sigma-54 dependent transcriptional regulator, partial [Roseiflexaceae bacterium]